MPEETFKDSMISSATTSKAKDPTIDEQVDTNVEKILKILCKVLLSEAMTEVSLTLDKDSPKKSKSHNSSRKLSIKKEKRILSLAQLEGERETHFTFKALGPTVLNSSPYLEAAVELCWWSTAPWPCSG